MLGFLVCKFYSFSIINSQVVYYKDHFEYKSNFYPSISIRNQTKSKFKILSLDGGGIRGLATLIMLDYIEKKTGKPISQLFDLIAGTSTGSIIATLLTLPDKNGKPKYTAEQAVNIYGFLGPRMFLSKLSSFLGIESAIYSKTNKRFQINHFVNGLKLPDLLLPMVVPAIDIRSYSPYLFNTYCASRNDLCNYDLLDVLDAATSAPTYFKPTISFGMDAPKPYNYRSFIDGAVIANSPEIIAINHAKKEYNCSEEDIFMISLGTGHKVLGKDHDDVKNWGYYSWALHFAEISIESSALLSNYLSKTTLAKDNYFRFQFDIDDPNHERIDNVSLDNLNYLKNRATSFIYSKFLEFDKACDLLLNSSI